MSLVSLRLTFIVRSCMYSTWRQEQNQMTLSLPLLRLIACSGGNKFEMPCFTTFFFLRLTNSRESHEFFVISSLSHLEKSLLSVYTVVSSTVSQTQRQTHVSLSWSCLFVCSNVVSVSQSLVSSLDKLCEERMFREGLRTVSPFCVITSIWSELYPKEGKRNTTFSWWLEKRVKGDEAWEGKHSSCVSPSGQEPVQEKSNKHQEDEREGVRERNRIKGETDTKRFNYWLLQY